MLYLLLFPLSEHFNAFNVNWIYFRFKFTNDLFSNSIHTTNSWNNPDFISNSNLAILATITLECQVSFGMR